MGVGMDVGVPASEGGPGSWGWKRAVRFVTGWLLIVGGVVGCVLPILPGVPMILGGLALLGTEYAWARRWTEQFQRWIARVRRKL